MLGNTRKYSEILGNTRKYSEILGNTRKEGVLPVRFAAPLFTPVFPCVPPGITRKCSTIPLNPVGNSQIFSEMLGKTWKNSEIPGNTRKSSETRGSACALCCSSVYPCVPLCTLGNTRKCSTIPLNPAGNTQIFSEMHGNARKYSDKLGNTRKSSEILGNKGFCLCASLHPCVPKCPPVNPPAIIGNARQYPSIRWEILRNTRKCSEILGNTRKNSEKLGNTRKYSETRGSACALCCTGLCPPVYPYVPPGNTRKCSTISLNPVGNTQKFWESSEMLGNTRK